MLCNAGLRKTNSLAVALKEFKEAAAMEVKQAIRSVLNHKLNDVLSVTAVQQKHGLPTYPWQPFVCKIASNH